MVRMALSSRYAEKRGVEARHFKAQKTDPSPPFANGATGFGKPPLPLRQDNKF